MAPPSTDAPPNLPECWPPPLTEEEEALRQRAGRLLESLRQIPKVCCDLKAWENEHENVFSLFRRGCLDGATTGILEAPIYNNRQIEDAWLFLIEMCQKHPNRRKQIEECASILGVSYNWSIPLCGSRKIRTALTAMPSTLRRQVLEAAVAHDILKAIEVEYYTKMQTAAMQDHQSDLHVSLYGRPLFADATTTYSSPVRGREDLAENFGQEQYYGLNPFGSRTHYDQSVSSLKTLSAQRSQSSAEMHPEASFSCEPDGHATPRRTSNGTGVALSGSLPSHWPSERLAPTTFHGPPKPNPNNPFRTQTNPDLHKKSPKEEELANGRGGVKVAPRNGSHENEVPYPDTTLCPTVSFSRIRSEEARRLPLPPQRQMAPVAGRSTQWL